MSTGRVAIASLAGMGPIMGPFSGSDVHVETSNFLPSFALEIPLLEVVTGPAGGGEETQSGTFGPPGDQPIAEASRTSTPTPTPPSTSRSSSTSSTSSSSSAATADSSVTSDTNHHLEFIPDNKHTQEEYKGLESQNDAPGSMPLIPEAKADTVGVKHLHSANMDTATTSSKTLALTTLLSVPTTVSSSSSSSTSLPPPTSSPSSSLSNSTSPSVTNINEQSADPNGLLSLLRPPFRSNPNLNVKFAPLPELAPRKRKSAIPLGMAARAQLAQRRRVMYQGGYEYHGEYDDPSTRSPPPSRRHQYMTPPDISGEDEGADGSGTGKKGKKKKGGEDAAATATGQQQQQQQQHDDLEDMPGDPFVFLAKKMGKAGRHFWKKVAHSGGKGGAGGGENGQSENVAMAAAPINEKEEPQSTSENPGDGEKDAKGAPEPDAVLPEHGLSLPVTQSLPLDESPRAAEGGEGGEETKVILKTDAADPDEILIDLSTSIPHPTVVS